MKETEITVEILGNVEETKKKIEESGLNIVSKFLMKDYYYSKLSLEELEALAYEDLIKNSFLIRSFKGDSKNRPNSILYKNKVLDAKGNVIAEEKEYVVVGDEKKAKKIFDLAKLTCWCEMEQKMTLFQNEKMKFVVQEIDGLGAFIEYEEDESMQGLDEMGKVQLMLNNLKSLGIDIGEDFSCKKVYMKFKNQK